ncbi:monothiol glutaredoxin-S15, mitochondrial isoform X2 [Aristolochia californica]|uniref:monothiol glutaredoxin-S15, mitochondrial isoform X2 n=1 Tax=Aristolochia californica TaxID=171875 RepID=UPI0035E0CAE8
MARLLSSAMLKGIERFQASPLRKLVVPGSFYQHDLRHSTSIPGDSDTHQDFQPANKLKDSNLSVKDIVEKDVKESPVMIYMKGVPDAPQCGFSQLAVRVLKHYGVPINARNILEDLELKNSVKSYSNWPTFPQIFINGEFIGGSDIILQMHQNGELREKLKDLTGGTNQEKAE